MHDHYGTAAGRDCFSQGCEIHLPAVIVEQGIWDDANISEIREKFEERVARYGNENFVSRFAEQSKNVAVGLAGACSEHNAFGIDTSRRSRKGRTATVILGDCFACFAEPLTSSARC